MIRHDIIEQIKKNCGGITAIVEPTQSCNLNCKYCYTQKQNGTSMDIATLQKIIDTIVIHNGKERISRFIWHGGEPLLAGINFFESIVRLERPYFDQGYRIHNSIQTNLTLLTDEYIDFFVQHKFGVGSSLDGIRDVHDYFRGQGTFDVVMENYARAKSKGLTVGFICVLNRKNLGAIKEIYEFFRDNELHLSITPMFPSPSFGEDLITPDEYFSTIRQLFDLYYWDTQCHITVNPCHGLIQGILLDGITLNCVFTGNCINNFITFLPNGDVYPCNRFTDHNEYWLGNIMQSSFEELLQNPTRQKILSRTPENMPDCRECKFKNYCRGGCMNHAYSFYGDIFARDYYCQAFYKAFEYAQNLVQSSIKKAAV